MKRLLFDALGSAADGAFVVDRDQRIIYWNRAAERILGHTSGNILGQPCHEVLSGQDVQGCVACRHHCSVVGTAFGGKPVPNFDMSVRTRSGDTRWLDVSTFVFPGGEETSGSLLVHLFRDITRRKQTEHLLHQVLVAANRLREEGLSPESPPAPAPVADAELTEREREVLSLLARGASTTEMARSLSISTSTVRNHIRSILNKFQVHSRIEAVLYGVKQGLITLD